ncbi:TPA: hypothetical protein L6B08_29540, partial [Pseudomonas aeruginosa]|nr:hypothetical protein [Pseudomonas aeruginosa]HBP6823988.1 hypothetical protein [Pseudomonas aeruginosa]
MSPQVQRGAGLQQLPHRSDVLHVVTVQVRLELQRNIVVRIQRFDLFLDRQALSGQVAEVLHTCRGARRARGRQGIVVSDTKRPVFVLYVFTITLGFALTGLFLELIQFVSQEVVLRRIPRRPGCCVQIALACIRVLHHGADQP